MRRKTQKRGRIHEDQEKVHLHSVTLLRGRESGQPIKPERGKGLDSDCNIINRARRATTGPNRSRSRWRRWRRQRRRRLVIRSCFTTKKRSSSTGNRTRINDVLDQITLNERRASFYPSLGQSRKICYYTARVHERNHARPPDGKYFSRDVF